jgi:hypothetical protein
MTKAKSYLEIVLRMIQTKRANDGTRTRGMVVPQTTALTTWLRSPYAGFSIAPGFILDLLSKPVRHFSISNAFTERSQLF